MNNTRSLKTGDLATVPASSRVHGLGRKTAVVESVSLNGLWFIDTNGTHHYIGDTELVPLADDTVAKVA